MPDNPKLIDAILARHALARVGVIQVAAGK